MEESTQKDPKNSQHTLELSDDEDDNPAPRPKKSKRRKQSQKKSKVINSDDSSSDVQVTTQKKAKKVNSADILDSDIEEIQKPKENAEEELGEW